jgi:hypothetical protein
MARHLSLAPRNLGAGNFLAITVKEVALKTIILSDREDSRGGAKLHCLEAEQVQPVSCHRCGLTALGDAPVGTCRSYVM